MTNPIDRALERLVKEGYLAAADATMYDKPHEILTDLAAEIRAEEEHYLEKAAELADRLEDQNDGLKARLAAVEELAKEQVEDYANEVGTDNYYHGQYDLAVDMLAIARGEAESNASCNDTKEAEDR